MPNPPDDLMAFLQQARPDNLDPVPDPVRRDRDLARILASAPAEKRRPRRLVLRYGLGLGLAAAAAAAVLVTTLTGTPAPAPTTAPALGASQILLTAADQVERVQPATGRFWVARSTLSYLSQVGAAGDRYNVRSRTRYDEWTAWSASEDSWWISQYLGAAPVSAADQAAWLRAGSPTNWTVPKASGAGGSRESTTGRPATGGQSNYGAAVFNLGGRNVTVKQLQALPSNPAELKRLLLTYYRDPGSTSELPSTPAAWMFQVGAGMLSMPITPAVRSATYRIMATLPGVRSLGTTRDIDGRPGNGVAIQDRDPYGTAEYRVLIDPETGLPQAVETVYLKATGDRAWLTPDDVWYAQLFQSLTWTDDPPPEIPTK